MNSYLAFIAGIAVTIAIVTLWNWSGARDELLLMDEIEALRRQLDRIAAMETPRCASIGKRMSAVARGNV